MKVFLRACAGVALACCVGCGGSTPALNLTPSAAQRSTVSWMSRAAAKSTALLYVADQSESNVNVFGYDNGKSTGLVGRLTGFSPSGECVDPSGNIYFTASPKIYEFAHGGAKPVRTLDDKDGYALSCAVDPLTGSLAVVNSYGPASSFGYVLIWANAKGRAKLVYVPNIEHPEYCTFDPSGDVFVNGYDDSVNLALEELPRGAKKFVSISVSGAKVESPKSMQWSSPYLLVGDSFFRDKNTSGIYELSISQSTGTVVGAIALHRSSQIAQFWKQGSRIVTASSGVKVPVYDFPSGDLYGKIDNGIYVADGVVVSLAPR